MDISAAAPIWAALIPSLAGGEPWALDFFAHISRVRDFCRQRNVPFREPNPRVVVVSAPEEKALAPVLARFAGERFGIRAGGAALSGEMARERQIADELAAKGADAYDAVYHECLFCGICDFESGSLTILSDKLWATEVIRRAGPALKQLGVEATRPE